MPLFYLLSHAKLHTFLETDLNAISLPKHLSHSKTKKLKVFTREPRSAADSISDCVVVVLVLASK